jgi:succinate dehydrogenase / fumarate reductase, iron-sulfur subunit
MKVKVYRFNPNKDQEAYFQKYELPITKEERFTVMDILKYIYEQLDTSLSFYSHSVCNHGICGRCAMKINGKVKLACTCLVEEDEITIEPISHNVIKDLVVNNK